MIEFTWELISGVTLGIEHVDNPEFNVKGDPLKYILIFHLGIVRLVFSKYTIEN